VVLGLDPRLKRLVAEAMKAKERIEGGTLVTPLPTVQKPPSRSGNLAMNYDMFGDIHVVPRSFCLIKDLNMEVFEPFVRKWGHVLGEQYGGCQQLG
jgi:hypothetical protein